MRLAYADPPYPGQSQMYRDHPDYAGEVDHAELIERMSREYDAWVLHTGAKHLQQILALCPDDVRVLAWTKGWASFKPAAEVKYAWEPVITWNPRGRDRKVPIVRDWFMCNIVTAATGGTITGQKPVALCHWIFEGLGLSHDDDLDDLFPGSGAVGRAWESWRNQMRLAV